MNPCGSGKLGKFTCLVAVVAPTTATLLDKAVVSFRCIIEQRSEAIMQIYSPSQFAEKHGVSSSRIRKLLAEERIFPYQKTSNGRYILFANSVIVAPYDRPNRRLRRGG